MCEQTASYLEKQSNKIFLNIVEKAQTWLLQYENFQTWLLQYENFRGSMPPNPLEPRLGQLEKFRLFQIRLELELELHSFSKLD